MNEGKELVSLSEREKREAILYTNNLFIKLIYLLNYLYIHSFIQEASL